MLETEFALYQSLQFEELSAKAREKATIRICLQGEYQCCSGGGTRWNAVPPNNLRVERRSTIYSWC